MEIPKKRLGDILIDCNLISEDQLKRALGYQRENGLKLGEALIKLELVTEDDIIWALGNQLNISFIHLNPQIVDPIVVKMISAEFAREHRVIPLYKSGNQLSICMVDPLESDAIEYIASTTRLDVSVSICTQFDFEQTFAAVYGPIEIQEKTVSPDASAEKEQLDKGVAKGMEGPEKVINYILGQAITGKVSKVHFEPSDKGVQIRFRTCSGLVRKLEIPVKIHQEIIAKLKTLAQIPLPPGPAFAVQNGHFRVSVSGRSISVHALFYPTVNGEMVVLQISYCGDDTRELVGSGVELLDQVKAHLQRNPGVLYISGPRESGRTFSGYYLTGSYDLNRYQAITVEYPVQANLAHITQIQVGSNGLKSSSEAFRLALQLDGDVILLDAPDDLGIYEDLAYAGLGGKTMLKTMTAHDAASTLQRVLSAFPDPLVIAHSCSGILSQRLVRVLCADCKKPYTPTEDECQSLKGLEGVGGQGTWFQPQGCEKCLGTGYSGRTLVGEFVPSGSGLAQMIINKQSYQELYHFFRKQGIPSLLERVSQLIQRGETGFDEIHRLF
jgi:type IV pilus assembly protein PilB